jgi:HEAT repeat protein
MRPILAFLLVIMLTGCRSRPVVDSAPRVRHWIETLRRDDARLRKVAAFKLGNLGLTDAGIVVPALMAALEDVDASVRREAILALLKCGPAAREAAGKLTEVERKDSDATVREYADRALKKFEAIK